MPDTATPLMAEGTFMFIFYTFCRNFVGHLHRQDDCGATAAEYALFIGLIAAVIFGAVLTLGQVVLGLFTAPITAGF